MKKKALIIFTLSLIFLILFSCNDDNTNCIPLGSGKICLLKNDEIISINSNYYYFISNQENIIYFEGIAQSGGVNIEDALNKARVDAAIKMKDFFGVDISTINGKVTINYGSIKELSKELIYLLNKSLEYIVFKRNRGNFYEIHTILIFIPNNKEFIPIYEDEFSKKIKKFATKN